MTEDEIISALYEKLIKDYKGERNGKAFFTAGFKAALTYKRKSVVKPDGQKKIPFTETNIYDKKEFAKVFPEWGKDKWKYYYDAALSYSKEGNKYVDWVLAIKNWHSRDVLNGKWKNKPEAESDKPKRKTPFLN